MPNMRWRWTEQAIEILRRDYPHVATAALAARIGCSVHSVYAKVARLGLRKSAEYMAGPHAWRLRHGPHPGTEHQFQPGHRPWNLGLKGLQTGGRSVLTRFKPGGLPWNTLPLGGERFSKDGYRQRKVSETGYPPRDWIGVHVLLWQEAHGPVPPGHVVIFIDGDKTHLDVANLALVKRAALAYLNKHGYAKLPAELRPSAIALARLQAEKSARARSL